MTKAEVVGENRRLRSDLMHERACNIHLIRKLEAKIEEQDAIIKEKDEFIEACEKDAKSLEEWMDKNRKDYEELQRQLWAYKIYERKRQKAGFEDTQEERLMRLEAIEEAKHGVHIL